LRYKYRDEDDDQEDMKTWLEGPIEFEDMKDLIRTKLKNSNMASGELDPADSSALGLLEPSTSLISVAGVSIKYPQISSHKTSTDSQSHHHSSTLHQPSVAPSDQD